LGNDTIQNHVHLTDLQILIEVQMGIEDQNIVASTNDLIAGPSDDTEIGRIRKLRLYRGGIGQSQSTVGIVLVLVRLVINGQIFV
jgi:hypothetical protein